jgi:predicted amidophosphoribosyltransferase
MSVWEELLALLAPPACAACREPLTRADAIACAACLRALPWLPARCCPRCALPGHRRGRCSARRSALDGAWAAMAYEGTARALVGALKFRGALVAADLMAAHVAANAPRALLAGAVLVPVPAAPARRRGRGFDQAAALAAALSTRTGAPIEAVLERRGAARRQVGASRRERLAAGRLAILAHGPAPAAALLVDDVHTTGATLDACARALRAAGAHRVHAVTYARTLDNVSVHKSSTGL